MSKGFWSLKKESEAIEYLLGTIPSSNRPQGYFHVMGYLFTKEDFRTAHRISKTMLNKSKNSSIQVWVKAHIFYAYSLLYNSKPQKAIVLLKCLGKVFPFLPFTFTPYISQLRKASCIEDLEQAAERASEVPASYEETSFSIENLFTPEYFLNINEKKLNNKEICNNLLQEESVFTENNSSIGMKSLNLSEVFNKYKTSRESSTSLASLNSEKVNNLIKFCERSSFSGYSISSKIKFVYLIGKFASIASICIEDGLCAIEDYITLLQNYPKKRKNEIKAMIIKSKLLVELKDYTTAKNILTEILPEVQQLKMQSKQAEINSLMLQIN